MKPVKGPWGGSSPFVSQMASFLRRLRYRVVYGLEPGVDAIVLVDPRTDNENKTFGIEQIADFKREHPGVRVVHRINECDQRKGTDFMDGLLAEASKTADFTVFISSWLREYHGARWFDLDRPNEVIYNGADPAVFHPVGGSVFGGSEPFRLVTHHWSNNPLKGFDVYSQVDRLLSEGALEGVELHVIGRWPEEIRWRAARTFPPLRGRELADRLRACHAYITASRWEPCGMHHVEGAQCGLPLIYHTDGGGIVEAGERYGTGFSHDVAAAIEGARRDYSSLRRRLFENAPSGDLMCLSYARIIQGLLCGLFEEGGAGPAGRVEK
jgi:glycosyltransferase involved in cell wall biosynthesis